MSQNMPPKGQSQACPALLEYALIDLTTKALFKNCFSYIQQLQNQKA